MATRSDTISEPALRDPVEEASWESFPASDPPAWAVGRAAHIDGPTITPVRMPEAQRLGPEIQTGADPHLLGWQDQWRWQAL